MVGKGVRVTACEHWPQELGAGVATCGACGAKLKETSNFCAVCKGGGWVNAGGEDRPCPWCEGCGVEFVEGEDLCRERGIE